MRLSRRIIAFAMLLFAAFSAFVVVNRNMHVKVAESTHGNTSAAVAKPMVAAEAQDVEILDPQKQEIKENSALRGSIEEIVDLYGTRGDAESTFLVFQAFYECYMRSVGGGGFDEIICDGFKSTDIPLMDEYLRRSADAGHVPAQLSYYAFAGRDYETAADIARNIEGFKEYRQRAANYLRAAAAAKSLDAMVTLASAYEDGTIVDKDPKLAYAYWLAAQHTGLRQSVDGLLMRIGAGLSPEQIEEAERYAQVISGQ